MILWKGKNSDLSWKKELGGEQGCGIVSMKVKICRCFTQVTLSKEKKEKKRLFSILSTFWHVPLALFGKKMTIFLPNNKYFFFHFLLLDSLAKRKVFVLVLFLDRKVCILKLGNLCLRTSLLSFTDRHMCREPGSKFWAELPCNGVLCRLQTPKLNLRLLGWEKQPVNLIGCWQMKEKQKTISHVVHNLN